MWPSEQHREEKDAERVTLGGRFGVEIERGDLRNRKDFKT